MDQDLSPLAAPLPAQSEEEGLGAGAPCSCRGTDIFPHVLFPSPHRDIWKILQLPRGGARGKTGAHQSFSQGS